MKIEIYMDQTEERAFLWFKKRKRNEEIFSKLKLGGGSVKTWGCFALQWCGLICVPVKWIQKDNKVSSSQVLPTA